ncbi:MAG TPA: hypothetical protein VN032_01915 [Thermoanaerobaculia bacterium]|jgi:hypothetical protein|nr:hypothetical protein [Thermoanaerobaculia bacterium]
MTRPPDGDAAAYDAVDSKIRAFEAIHGERVYLVGRPTDAMLLPDGTIGYVLEWPPAEMRNASGASWALIAHPVRDRFSTPIDPVTGEPVAIGSAPDGTYYGFAWFMETVPDVVMSGDHVMPASLYETHPPDIERLYAERARFSEPMRAAVQRWWAEQDEWTEGLRAGDLVEHRGVISGCRETDEATVVTVKGDGTFEFLYRDLDRVTYEGASASSPCDLVGRRVVIWTLPCGDEGAPCIRKIEAIDGPAEVPSASVAEAVAEESVPHGGVISDCRETDVATVVTVKGDGTFQFLHRRGDRVDYEGVQARSPCDFIGKKVVVWTFGCGEDSPCIGTVQLLGGQ